MESIDAKIQLSPQRTWERVYSGVKCEWPGNIHIQVSTNIIAVVWMRMAPIGSYVWTLGWSPIGRPVWERLGVVALEEVCHWR